MKNHHIRNGQLVQTNKKWNQLKQNQREWISHALKERYVNHLLQNNGVVTPAECETMLQEVTALLDEKLIWLPEKELRNYFNSRKVKWKKKTT